MRRAGRKGVALIGAIAAALLLASACSSNSSGGSSGSGQVTLKVRLRHVRLQGSRPVRGVPEAAPQHQDRRGQRVEQEAILDRPADQPRRRAGARRRPGHRGRPDRRGDIDAWATSSSTSTRSGRSTRTTGLLLEESRHHGQDGKVIGAGHRHRPDGASATAPTCSRRPACRPTRRRSPRCGPAAGTSTSTRRQGVQGQAPAKGTYFTGLRERHVQRRGRPAAQQYYDASGKLIYGQQPGVKQAWDLAGEAAPRAERQAQPVQPRRGTPRFAQRHVRHHRLPRVDGRPHQGPRPVAQRGQVEHRQQPRRRPPTGVARSSPSRRQSTHRGGHEARHVADRRRAAGRRLQGGRQLPVERKARGRPAVQTRRTSTSATLALLRTTRSTRRSARSTATAAKRSAGHPRRRSDGEVKDAISTAITRH